MIEQSLGKMWMFQWSEQVYVAILPLLAIWFYRNKYAEHPDYEALHKAGNETFILFCKQSFEPSLQNFSGQAAILTTRSYEFTAYI